MSKLISLKNKNLDLKLAPACGGAIAEFSLQTTSKSIQLMRPATTAAIENSDPLFTSCFPLVPFSNRIENGEFTAGNKQVKVTINMPPHPHPLHGQGWRHSWDIEQQNDSSTTLVYIHKAGDDGWPWQYRAKQTFSLLDSSLIISLSLHNMDTSAMPAGLGLHPYFPRTADVELDIPLQQVWLTDELCIPHSVEAIPDKWQLVNGRSLEAIVLDHCFSGWNGQASIRWPSENVSLHIKHSGICKHAVIFVPEGEDFFCIEPVSNVTNAVNLAAQGIENTGHIELSPDESITAEVTFAVEY